VFRLSEKQKNPVLVSAFLQADLKNIFPFSPKPHT